VAAGGAKSVKQVVVNHVDPVGDERGTLVSQGGFRLGRDVAQLTGKGRTRHSYQGR
jgi:hypothetical protein